HRPGAPAGSGHRGFLAAAGSLAGGGPVLPQRAGQPARTVALAVRGPRPVARRPAHRPGIALPARAFGRGHRPADGPQHVGRGAVTRSWDEKPPRAAGRPPVRTSWPARTPTSWSETSAWTIWSSPTWRRSRPARSRTPPGG